MLGFGSSVIGKLGDLIGWSVNRSPLPDQTPQLDEAPASRSRGASITKDAEGITRRSVPLRALVIGIDEYACVDIPNLAGAVSDADAIDDYLRNELCVPKEHIVNLRNEQATRDAVIREIKALSTREGIRRGDPILIYFAGHGTTAPAPAGWHVGKQSVSLIAPHDTDTKLEDAGMSKFAIPDRTIGALLHLLAEQLGTDDAGANITVIFDCCHSGSGTRSIPSPAFVDTRRARGFTSKSVLPETLDQDILNEVPQGRGLSVVKGFTQAGTRSHILLAACRESESAFENNQRGYFTDGLLSALRSVELTKATYQDLMRHISSNIAGQTPQCEGHNPNRILFDARVTSRIRATYQLHKKAGVFAVDIGSIHGVDDDTTFSVYARDDFKPDEMPMATMVVRRVYAFTTELECLGPLTRDGHAALSGAQCVAVPNSMGSATALRLHVPAATDPGQRRVLEALGNVVHAHRAGGGPAIFLRNDPTQANLSIRITEDDATYTIHDRSITDRGLSRLSRTTKADVDAIQPVLSAAAHFFWHLHHAPKKNVLNDRIEIRFCKLEPDVDADFGPDLRLPYVARDPDLYNSGIVDVVADDETPYGILVRNNSTVPLHVWAFYFNCGTLAIHEYYRPPAAGPNAAPSLPASKCNHLQCSHTQEDIDDMKGELMIGYGNGGGQPYTFVVPDDYEDVDVGFIKLFISTEPVDLSGIPQHSPLDPAVSRDITPKKTRPSDGVWDTFTIAVVQHRP
ncbi:unnamed protein product [Peniophora sp. CBMAI 1063]|nr:unnamed protein product [Peniophora sp. CBMAI 1063]